MIRHLGHEMSISFPQVNVSRIDVELGEADGLLIKAELEQREKSEALQDAISKANLANERMHAARRYLHDADVRLSEAQKKWRERYDEILHDPSVAVGCEHQRTRLSTEAEPVTTNNNQEDG